MADDWTADPKLAKVTDACDALPEATRTINRSSASFSVRSKNFAYFLSDHYDEEGVSVVCKVAHGENEALIASDPKRYYMPRYVGPKGWVGLRLTGRVNWTEVEGLLTESYALIAPKTLSRRVEP